MKSPLVSVIVPAYNAEHYIKEAIDSILNQTYKNLEIIVVNDGSTDNTLSILKEYGGQIKHISQVNKGPSSARNAGIKIAKGEFIAYQDADDISLPKRIEQEVKYLSDNPDLSMVFTGHKVAFLDNPDKKFKIQMPSHHSTLSLLQHNYIPCTTVMHRKDILSVVGCWNENVDWDLWIRISEKFKIGYIKECLSEYRKRGTGISTMRGRLKNRLIDLQMFKDRYKRKKEMWIQVKVKRIEFECWLMRKIVFKNTRLELIFWCIFQKISNMVETVVYVIERKRK